MSESSLIIDVRNRLKWHQRIFTDVGTFALWCFWGWLSFPLLALMCNTWIGKHVKSSDVFNCTPTSIEKYAFSVLSVCAGLSIWKILSKNSISPKSTQNIKIEEHFGVTSEKLTAARNSSVCVVHHDAEGRIVQIDSSSRLLS